MVVLVGLPVLQGSRLFNAAALLQSGAVRGVVPKTFLPGYKEYYEERWFSSSREVVASTLPLAGREVPFGTDLLFAVEGEPGVVVGVEICEDLWAPIPPSCQQAIAGATLILNPSAGNDLVGKADYRRELVAQQSAPHALGLRLRQRGRSRVDHRPRLRRPLAGRRARRRAGRKRAFPPRGGARLRGRRYRAAARRTRTADVLCGGGARRAPAVPDRPARPRAGCARPPAAAHGRAAPLRAGRPGHRRRALPGGLLDPDRRPGAACRAHRLAPPGARPLRRARLDAGAAGLRPHAGPARPARARTCSR